MNKLRSAKNISLLQCSNQETILRISHFNLSRNNEINRLFFKIHFRLRLDIRTLRSAFLIERFFCFVFSDGTFHGDKIKIAFVGNRSSSCAFQEISFSFLIIFFIPVPFGRTDHRIDIPFQMFLLLHYLETI